MLAYGVSVDNASGDAIYVPAAAPARRVRVSQNRRRWSRPPASGSPPASWRPGSGGSTVLLIPLGLIAANSIYLVAFTQITSFFYGDAPPPPRRSGAHRDPLLRVRADARAADAPKMWNKQAKAAGIAIVTLAVVCVATGVTMAFRGATLNNRAGLARARLGRSRSRWSRSSSTAARTPQAPLPPAVRVGRRRRRASSCAMARPRTSWRSRRSGSSTSERRHACSSPPPPRRSTRGSSTASGFAANAYCKECHPDSFHAWEKSAHRFSSFNNPFYRQSVELMADRVGRERTKWCSGCHDPVVLFTGQMGSGDAGTLLVRLSSRRSRGSPACPATRSPR